MIRARDYKNELAKCRRQQKSLIKDGYNWDDNEVCNYSYIRKDKGIIHSDINYCHAGLYDYYGDGVDIIVNRVGNILCSEEEAIHYYDWLLKRSPFSKAFITKNPKKCVKPDDTILVRGDVDSRLVLQACTAARMPRESERDFIPRFFYEMKDLDLPENIKALLAYRVVFIEDSCRASTSTVSGHSFWSFYTEDKSVYENFFNNNLVGEVGSCYNNGTDGVNGSHLLFGEVTDRYREKPDWLMDRVLEAVSVCKEKLKEVNNIFLKEKVMVDKKDFFKQIKKIMEREGLV